LPTQNLVMGDTMIKAHLPLAMIPGVKSLNWISYLAC